MKDSIRLIASAIAVALLLQFILGLRWIVPAWIEFLVSGEGKPEALLVFETCIISIVLVIAYGLHRFVGYATLQWRMLGVTFITAIFLSNFHVGFLSGMAWLGDHSGSFGTWLIELLSLIALVATCAWAMHRRFSLVHGRLSYVKTFLCSAVFFSVLFFGFSTVIWWEQALLYIPGTFGSWHDEVLLFSFATIPFAASAFCAHRLYTRSAIARATAIVLISVTWLLFAPVGPVLFTLQVIERFLRQPYHTATYGGTVGLTMAPTLLVVFVLLALWTAAGNNTKAGLRITPEQQPDLWAVILDLCKQIGVKPPAALFVSGDWNFWVSKHRAVCGCCSGAYALGIGLPVFAVLNIAELRAVVAHELGHFASGDVLLGPWAFRTGLLLQQLRERIERSLGTRLGRHAFGRGVQWAVHKIYAEYFQVFAYIVGDVSRRQEVVADRIACDHCGQRWFESALRKLEGNRVAFETFWARLYEPVLRLGACAPLLDTYASFLETSGVTSQSLHAVMPSAGVLTHPSLHERLGQFNGPTGVDDAGAHQSSSRSLLRNPDALEVAVIAMATAYRVERRSWSEIEQSVLPAHWRAVLERSVDIRCDGVRIAGLPQFCRTLIDHARTTEDVREVERVVRAALATALLQNGWRVHCNPAREVCLRFGVHQLEPRTVVRQMLSGIMTAAMWAGHCDAMGLSAITIAVAYDHKQPRLTHLVPLEQVPL